MCASFLSYLLVYRLLGTLSFKVFSVLVFFFLSFVFPLLCLGSPSQKMKWSDPNAPPLCLRRKNKKRFQKQFQNLLVSLWVHEGGEKEQQNPPGSAGRRTEQCCQSCQVGEFGDSLGAFKLGDHKDILELHTF